MELLFSQDWNNPLNTNRNELVFENKNKKYGAYVIRKNYNQVMVKSLLITLTLLALILIPSFLISGKESRKEKVISNEQIVIDQINQDLKEELPPPPPPPPTEAPKVQSLKFVETEIVDETVEETIRTQEELENSNVGKTDQEGDDNINIPEDKGSSNGVVGQETVTEPFIIVEEMPSFQGGELSMMKYIQSQVRYPEYEKEADISGRVYLRFVVQTDGSVEQVQVIRGVSKGLDKEAIRVISSMPRWNPGKQGGRNVPVYFTLPINFTLN